MKLEVDIKCPNCEKEFKEKLERMRPGMTRSCPHCGNAIKFTGDDVGKIQKAVDDFVRSLKKS
jgi:hydrogenase maturation factor HypF (carbamoyltransferase family)